MFDETRGKGKIFTKLTILATEAVDVASLSGLPRTTSMAPVPTELSAAALRFGCGWSSSSRSAAGLAFEVRPDVELVADMIDLVFDSLAEKAG